MENAVRCDGDRSALHVAMKCGAMADEVHCVFEWSAERQEGQGRTEEKETSFLIDFTENTDPVGGYSIIVPLLSIRILHVLHSSEKLRPYLFPIRTIRKANPWDL